MLIKQPCYFSLKDSLFCQKTPYLVKESTRLRNCIKVDKRVGITLWRYASGYSARTISSMFGIRQSTCRKICFEVAESTCAELAPKFLATLSHEELKHQAWLFKSKWGMPICVGARDGSHVPIPG